MWSPLPWNLDIIIYFICQINATLTRQWATCDESPHLRQCWWSLWRWHSGPPRTLPCSWCSPRSRSWAYCRHVKAQCQLTGRAGLSEGDIKCVTKWDQPVCEAHAVLLNIQRGELLVVPQSLLLLAGDSQVEAQHGVWLQLHCLTSIQTWKAQFLRWAQTENPSIKKTKICQLKKKNTSIQN